MRTVIQIAIVLIAIGAGYMLATEFPSRSNSIYFAVGLAGGVFIRFMDDDSI